MRSHGGEICSCNENEGINLLCVVQHEIWQRVIYVYYNLLALCCGIS